MGYIMGTYGIIPGIIIGRIYKRIIKIKYNTGTFTLFKNSYFKLDKDIVLIKWEN